MLKSAGLSSAAVAAGVTPSTPSLAVKLAASAIPFVIAPTGTVANNGAITLGTALPAIYANAWINLPLNAIQAGSAAGWYFCQMSSATVGTVFNNPYTTGIPTIPTPVAFVSTGPGAYTGVTGAITGPQIPIPAGTPGPNGVLRLSELSSVNASTNAKVISAAIAGTTIWGATLSTGTQFGLSSTTTLYNRGAQNANIVTSVSNAFGVGVNSSANVFSSINFAAAQTLSLILNNAVATDFIVLESYLLEALPG